jgi:hypothetical protein
MMSGCSLSNPEIMSRTRSAVRTMMIERMIRFAEPECPGLRQDLVLLVSDEIHQLCPRDEFYWFHVTVNDANPVDGAAV